MTLARECIEAMGNGVESEAMHHLNRARLLRALRTLRDRGPSEASKRVTVYDERMFGEMWDEWLAELIREIEEEK